MLLLQVITTQRELTRTDEENRALMDLALRGLQLLSSWNVRIMELVSCISLFSRHDIQTFFHSIKLSSLQTFLF